MTSATTISARLGRHVPCSAGPRASAAGNTNSGRTGHATAGDCGGAWSAPTVHATSGGTVLDGSGSTDEAAGELDTPWVFEAMLTDGFDDEGSGVTVTSPGSTAPDTTVSARPRPRPTPRPKPGPGRGVDASSVSRHGAAPSARQSVPAETGADPAGPVASGGVLVVLGSAVGRFGRRRQQAG